MTDDTLSDLATYHRRQRAPDGALALAVANYREHFPAGSAVARWPVVALTAAALAAVVLIPALSRNAIDGEHAERPASVASLSLNRLDLPARPAVSISAAQANLASVTRLPISAPNLSRLSVAGEQTKETM